MISFGITRVLCAVSVEERVPRFLRGRGVGWVTTEYAMLPRSTHTRTARERGSGGGRTQEIQRLIGRSLRAVVNLDLLGERTFTVDCDVIQADGGTRTAAITGGYVALYLAFQRLVQEGRLSSVPLQAALAATSVGQLGDEIIVDLCYEEDYSFTFLPGAADDATSTGGSVTGVFGFGIAFAGGFLSFLSPCILPLVPIYLSHLAGETANEVAELEAERDGVSA